MGCPVCPLGLRSFVPVWLATAQSQYSPDETSPEKSCFSTLLPQLSQQKHKHTITHTPVTSTGTHYLRSRQKGGKRAETLWELSLPLLPFFFPSSRSFTPTHTHPSSSSLSGLLGIVLVDFAPLWWMICLKILSVHEQAQRPGGRTYLQSEKSHYFSATFPFLYPQVNHSTEHICVYLWMCVCVCDNLQPF